MINGIQLANKLRGTAAVSTNLPDEIRDLLFQAAYAVDRLLVLRPGWEGSDHSDPPTVERIEELEQLLRSGIQLVESLKVFGNDNIHKYDVPAWLGMVKGKLGIPAAPTADTGEKP